MLLSCSIGYCQNEIDCDTLHIPLRGVEQDSIILSVGEIHILNSKLIELEFSKLKIEQLKNQVSDYKTLVNLLDNKVINLEKDVEDYKKQVEKERKLKFIFGSTTACFGIIAITLLCF